MLEALLKHLQGGQPVGHYMSCLKCLHGGHERAAKTSPMNVILLATHSFFS